MVVTTQYSSWANNFNQRSSKTPDILGLTKNGELIVVELKRAGDNGIHLQAIGYAALCSAFNYRTLAEAHAKWMSHGRTRYGLSAESMSTEEALNLIDEHLDGIDDPEETFPIPTIVLVAEEFLPETITTVEWLWSVSDAFAIRCIEYSTFRAEDLSSYVYFDQVWPVANTDEQILRPLVQSLISEKRADIERKRKQNVAPVLVSNRVIPEGTTITLPVHNIPDRYFQADQRQRMKELLDRIEICWTNQEKASKPLQVTGLGSDPVCLAPSRLWKELLIRIGAEDKQIDINSFLYANGAPLSVIANGIEQGDSDSLPGGDVQSESQSGDKPADIDSSGEDDVNARTDD